MLALLGKEKGHHSVAVASVGRRTEKHIHRLSLSDFNNASRSVIAGSVAVKFVAFVNKNSGKGFRCVAAMGYCFHKCSDILSLPAEVKGCAYSRMRTAVTHCNKDIIFTKLDS